MISGEYSAPLPPAVLGAPWIVGDYDYTELVCEQHALEYARDRGLVWDHPGSTGESAAGYAYTVPFFGDLESDHPAVCSVCHTYLDTALTPDGVEYVREHYAPEWWHLWGVTA